MDGEEKKKPGRPPTHNFLTYQEYLAYKNQKAKEYYHNKKQGLEPNLVDIDDKGKKTYQVLHSDTFIR